MAIHVAILKKPLLRQVLDGRKTVESRITKTPRPPYGMIEPGQRIYLKASGGPFMGLARAGQVRTFDQLTPRRLSRLEQDYNQRVCGDRDYWRSRKNNSFAVFIDLEQVQPIDVGPAYPRLNMVAWHVLDDRHDPVREITITGANLRNNYVQLPGVTNELRQSTLTLVMPDERVIRTNFTKGSMLRWRGWGRYFREHRMRAGDTVRFTAVGNRRFCVSFHPA